MGAAAAAGPGTVEPAAAQLAGNAGHYHGVRPCSSVLDDIEGVGPARRKALMKHFLDINVIRNADVEELMQADGITRQVAGNIYRYFH